jgi:signal transduction histidine kinase
VAEGAPLGVLVAQAEQSALRNFLALPARYAGGVRPAIALKGARAGQTLTLFAEGRAGIVSGYFGLLSAGGVQAAAVPGKGALPAAALGRITRGLRRPLNTIAGFSELIASEAFGPLANPRYLEYARDIRSASGEIGDLADELDDYVRLAEGEMAVSPADVDIGTLLAECLVRVRGQASKERVLLRSAISERLPMARVDAATLKQAVLNMLASAISEAGEGSRVVLSGQAEEDGSVSIHVRDAAKAPGILAERFVVFRDGVAADGSQRKPSQSSIGLTLTRSLVAVNACSLSLYPVSESGTLMTLTIPASLVVR